MVLGADREGGEEPPAPQASRLVTDDGSQESEQRERAPEEVRDIEVRGVRVVREGQVHADERRCAPPGPPAAQLLGHLRDGPHDAEGHRQRNEARAIRDGGHVRHVEDLGHHVGRSQRGCAGEGDQRHGSGHQREQDEVHRRIRVEAAGRHGLHQASEEVPRRDAVVVPPVGRRETPADAHHAQDEDGRQQPRQRRAQRLRDGLPQRREARGTARGTHPAKAS